MTSSLDNKIAVLESKICRASTKIENIKNVISGYFNPVKYFRKYNILPSEIVDAEIIDKHFNNKWLHKKHIYHSQIECINNTYIEMMDRLYDDYNIMFKIYVNDVVFKDVINPLIRDTIKPNLSSETFEENKSEYIKLLNFDESPYYEKLFNSWVYEYINKRKMYIDNIELNILELKNYLTYDIICLLSEIISTSTIYFKLGNVYGNNYGYYELIKICPKTIKCRKIKTCYENDNDDDDNDIDSDIDSDDENVYSCLDTNALSITNLQKSIFIDEIKMGIKFYYSDEETLNGRLLLKELNRNNIETYIMFNK